jgi:hypothetical protein
MSEVATHTKKAINSGYRMALCPECNRLRKSSNLREVILPNKKEIQFICIKCLKARSK